MVSSCGFFLFFGFFGVKNTVSVCFLFQERTLYLQLLLRSDINDVKFFISIHGNQDSGIHPLQKIRSIHYVHNSNGSHHFFHETEKFKLKQEWLNNLVLLTATLSILYGTVIFCRPEHLISWALLQITYKKHTHIEKTKI